MHNSDPTNYPVETADDCNWEYGTAMYGKRLLGASVTIDNNIYLLGGATLDGSVVPNFHNTKSHVWIYDAVGDSWDNTAASMPAARYAHAAALVGTNIYVFGGLDNSDMATDTVWIYDTVGDSWNSTSETTMTTPLYGMAVTVIGNDAYLIGGVDDTGETVDTVYVYDTVAKTWSTETDLPSDRRYAAATSISGVIYITGGIDNSNTILGEVLSFDPNDGNWVDEGDLAVAVFGHGIGVIEGKLYMANGSSKYRSHSGWDAYFQSFDLSAGTGTEHTGFFWGRYHVYYGVVGQKFFCFGGHKGKVGTAWSKNQVKNTAFYDVSLLD